MKDEGCLDRGLPEYPERACSGDDLASQIDAAYREAYLRSRLHPEDARICDCSRERETRYLVVGVCCLLAALAAVLAAVL